MPRDRSRRRSSPPDGQPQPPQPSLEDEADRFLREAGSLDGLQLDGELLDDDLLPDDDLLMEEDFPLGDGTADDSGLVYCPYCGEPAEVALDAGGGAVQRYVEDCPVCCRPWLLTVRYDASGAASVECEESDPG